MRIDGPLQLPENLQPENTQRSATSNSSSGSTQASSTQDKTQLSASAQNLDHLKSALAQTPEIRQDRVEALRQAIGSGNYHVSDQQLATAIYSELRNS